MGWSKIDRITKLLKVLVPAGSATGRGCLGADRKFQACVHAASANIHRFDIPENKGELEALVREREMREKRSEDAIKLKQAERAGKEQIEHLTRKCACLRKLFDDMRARLSARERDAEQEAKAREKEIHHLRGEVARLTRLLLEQGTPSLGDRTQADGCDSAQMSEFFPKAEQPACDQQNAPRRRSGTLRTPEPARKLPKAFEGARTRPNLPELAPIPPERRPTFDDQSGRRRSKSVDLPAVQVPVRIKQLEEMRNQ
ncbi:hypothetical protein EVAR_43906_1 [Eumeta japonica]|uniref:Uncharacterized protein n=1 Tax=Eumeta variegata TaxID=151549 RepID=A0A4C1WRF1_EUMVA|nr:hypothetical protein EVAR_43906_1 [Eumeta japonica]